MIMYLIFAFIFLVYTFTLVLHLDVCVRLVRPDILAGMIVYGILPLLGAGLLRDFGNAFRMVLSKKKKISVAKLKRAIDAVDLEVRGQILAAVLIGFASLLNLLYVYGGKDSYAFGEYLEYVGLPLVFALLLACLLLPLKYRLKVMLADYLSSPEE